MNVIYSDMKKNSPELTSLDFLHNFDMSSEVDNLVDALEKNHVLECISFSCFIGYNELIKIVDVIENSKTLKKIVFVVNQINAAGIDILFNALKVNSTLDYLYIFDQPICEKIAETANMLAENKTLTKLVFSSCNISDYGAWLVAIGLQNNSCLKSINISFNNIGPKGAEELALALCMNETLDTLELSNNDIGCMGAKHIAKSLEKNNVLTSLDLNTNNICDCGAIALLKALNVNTSLKDLYLDQNDCTDETVFELTKSPEKKRLEELRLLNNNITESGAKELLKAVKEKNLATMINIRNNGSSQVIIDELEKIGKINIMFMKRNMIFLFEHFYAVHAVFPREVIIKILAELLPEVDNAERIIYNNLRNYYRQK